MNDHACLIIDLDRCWGCRACEVACKQELSLGAGPRPLLVEEIGPRRLDAHLHKDYVPVMCQHCRQPVCVEACPEGAIQKVADASVQIDRDLCTRCQACLEACPYGAIDWAEKEGPVKCDLCLSRRQRDWWPSCAQHCPGRAVLLASEGPVASAMSEKKYSWRTGQVIYVSNKWASLGHAMEGREEENGKPILSRK
jgi:Fe-S-cluster-containing dehydrogenase component